MFVVVSEEFYGGNNIQLFRTRPEAEKWAQEFFKSGEIDYRIVELEPADTMTST